MKAELTGRQVKISKQLRQIADDGLARIEKIVGPGSSAHLILGAEKNRQLAEVTVHSRHHVLVGAGEAPDLAVALRTALEKAEQQAIRFKKRVLEKKRKGKSLSELQPEAEPNAAPAPAPAKKSKTVAAAAVEADHLAEFHIVPAPEAFIQRPLTVEQAVKEVEYRDHEVLVFRSPEGGVKVLHRTREGIVRLIEVS